MRKCKWWMLVLLAAAAAQVSEARIKLVALPDRGDTVIRLDNPAATLIEEERVLTLQKGVNKVDFAWNGVSLDVDSIRLTVLSHPEQVKLLNVSYPPNEQALVWELASPEALEVKARISYLLNGIDRLITYKAVADKEETQVDLKSHLVLRNFSGEDFTSARVLLNYGEAFEQGIQHEETKQLLFMKQDGIPIEKIWTFDAAKKPWDPEKVSGNVGIPVTYKIKNEKESKLGENSLWDGKVRVYQDDGHEGTIFLGEDNTALVPVGEEMEVYVGDSRDLVITQRKMQEKQINIRRNNSNHIVLYDTDEIITAKIENFKDKPAKLLLIQHIPGQWEMEKCSMEYERKDAGTLEFTVELKPQETRELTMHYHRRNVR
ncbi:MAG TPA: hypothetical protein PKM67_09525 [Kiritimatiellia bacterium]|nr:hypothetical protein [Kiritimatiellia bacterium]HNR94867.1 hypothetical protein [Kiritimatiellia bacterium]HNS81682.1 hypothetical protein [Kiritimatiellia bacterium]HPA78978.1 hypothetical protein [Kiritimatiellia bacterium]HQQ05146.1 hypothetical protein [Kiritimatiellia bacterium]